MGGDRGVPRGTFATPAFLEEESPQPPRRAGHRCPRPLRAGASGATLIPLLLQRHPSTLTTPEHTVELRGATLAWAGKDKSSKKHVLEVSRVTGRGDIGHLLGSTRGPWDGGDASTCPVHPTSSEGDVLGLVAVGTLGLGAKGHAMLLATVPFLRAWRCHQGISWLPEGVFHSGFAQGGGFQPPRLAHKRQQLGSSV